MDVAALKANPHLSGAFLVSGLVYSVTTGRIEIVVPPGLLFLIRRSAYQPV